MRHFFLNTMFVKSVFTSRIYSKNMHYVGKLKTFQKIRNILASLELIGYGRILIFYVFTVYSRSKY